VFNFSSHLFYVFVIVDQGLPVDCARELLGVTFSEAPEKHYFVLRQEHMVVEADATMQAIMEKLQVYRNRLTILFEVTSLHRFVGLSVESIHLVLQYCQV
jgi:hypothetical protein